MGESQAFENDGDVKQGKTKSVGKVAIRLQAPCRAHSKQVAHHQSQVSGDCRHQVPLANLFKSVKPRASRPAGFTNVSERSFNLFASLAPELQLHHLPPDWKPDVAVSLLDLLRRRFGTLGRDQPL